MRNEMLSRDDGECQLDCAQTYMRRTLVSAFPDPLVLNWDEPLVLNFNEFWLVDGALCARGRSRSVE